MMTTSTNLVSRVHSGEMESYFLGWRKGHLFRCRSTLFSLWKGSFCHWLATVPRHIWNRFLARNFFSTRNADVPRNSSNLLVSGGTDFYRAFLSISFFPPRERKFNLSQGDKEEFSPPFVRLWEWIFFYFFEKISTQIN